MLVSDFDFHLPEDLIAQTALPERAESRMLHLSRATGSFHDMRFRNLPQLLRKGDLLVVNDSRVFPARLLGQRSGSRSQAVSVRNPAHRDFLKGEVEVLLTRRISEWEWQALVRPGRKLPVGEKLSFGPGLELRAEITARDESGGRTIRFEPVPDFFAAIEQVGHVPLPPYIRRQDSPEDRERYQTIYASKTGSVAAPTAGLHFTPQILDEIRAAGTEIATLTLHVGLGTFQPIRVERVEEHVIHSEVYSIDHATAAAVNAALHEQRRVVAVGTTTVRALEHAARVSHKQGIQAGTGEADMFIYPGFEFRVTRALLTNFHLPRSSLLVLVCAFAGRERVISAYEHAVRERYRFFSYGDCMFVE